MHSTVYSVYYIDIRHLQCPVGVAIPAMLQIRCNYPSESGAHFSFVCRDLFIESQQQQLSSLCLQRKWQRSRQLGNLHVKFTDKNREERILLLQIIHICRKQT